MSSGAKAPSLECSSVAEDADASDKPATALHVSRGRSNPHKMPYEVGTLSPPSTMGQARRRVTGLRNVPKVTRLRVVVGIHPQAVGPQTCLRS